jgi:hypothetical protein
VTIVIAVIVAIAFVMVIASALRGLTTLLAELVAPAALQREAESLKIMACA